MSLSDIVLDVDDLRIYRSTIKDTTKATLNEYISKCKKYDNDINVYNIYMHHYYSIKNDVESRFRSYRVPGRFIPTNIWRTMSFNAKKEYNNESNRLKIAHFGGTEQEIIRNILHDKDISIVSLPVKPTFYDIVSNYFDIVNQIKKKGFATLTINCGPFHRCFNYDDELVVMLVNLGMICIIDTYTVDRDEHKSADCSGNGGYDRTVTDTISTLNVKI